MNSYNDRNHSDEPEVVLIPREQLDHAISLTVKSTGFSEHDLETQAKTGQFASDRARLAWDLVRDGRRTQAR